MNRRQFLESMSSALTLAGLAPFLRYSPQLWAQDAEPHFMVLLMVNGGMDVTLGLEGRVHGKSDDQKDVFLEYRPQDLIKVEDFTFGPAAKSLVPYATELAVINGINMRRDAGHDPNRIYLGSGRGDGKTPLLPMELAFLNKGQLPIDILVGPKLGASPGARTISQMSLSDIRIPVEGTGEFNSLESNTGEFEHIMNGYLKMREPLTHAQKALEVEDHKELATAPQELLLARGFQAGLSNFAALNLNKVGAADDSEIFEAFDLDKHTNHAGEDGKPGIHWREQEAVWNRVTDFFKAFKETPYQYGSLFDFTTFMVVTEFSRTPYLNGARGKDHNVYTNSVLLAGKNIQGGKVAGASKIIPRGRSATGAAEHMGCAIDFKTGKILSSAKPGTLAPSVNLIFPEDVARTVAGIFGNPSGFGSVNMDRLPIPGIIRA